MNDYSAVLPGSKAAEQKELGVTCTLLMILLYSLRNILLWWAQSSLMATRLSRGIAQLEALVAGNFGSLAAMQLLENALLRLTQVEGNKPNQVKAFTKIKYGGPEVLQLEEVEKPSVKEEHLLVKVRANSANPADWHILRGEPILARFAFGLFKPHNKILGADFAGVVEGVGNNVAHFRVGDPVFGESLKGGAFAEYICIEARVCGKMPKGAGFAQMASVPIAGLTALQALLTHGQLQAGESVLINGSSGGVGHFALQIAKAYGAEVTAVCSGKNVDFVNSLGADRVIAYDQENIRHHNHKYALILDTHGNLTYKDYQRMGHRGVVVGFTTMRHMIALSLRGKIGKFPLTQFTAQANTKDLEQLAGLIESGKIKVHLEKTYSYQDIPEAIAYIEAMRTRGKVAMVWDSNA